jgi:hypothetical protein
MAQMLKVADDSDHRQGGFDSYIKTWLTESLNRSMVDQKTFCSRSSVWSIARNSQLQFPRTLSDRLWQIEELMVDLNPKGANWRLLKDSKLIGFLHSCSQDWPWIICQFDPTPEFAEFADLFSYEASLLNSGGEAVQEKKRLKNRFRNRISR